MKIEALQKVWVSVNRDVRSEVKLWDSQSGDPTYHRMPDFENDEFLQLLQNENMLNKTGDVLDVGCGVGVYAIALSGRFMNATGIDISPKMLEYGETIITANGIENVSLRCADWLSLDLDRENMRDRFDLVFAHNTPAIGSMDAFLKLNDASRRYCAVCSPTKMIEPVMQKVQKIAGVGTADSSCENTFVYMLDALFQMDCLPKLYYEKQVWPMCQSYEDACSYYLGRITMSKPLSPKETAEIKAYLKSIVKDDVITDRIDATVTTLYWDKTVS